MSLLQRIKPVVWSMNYSIFSNRQPGCHWWFRTSHSTKISPDTWIIFKLKTVFLIKFALYWVTGTLIQRSQRYRGPSCKFNPWFSIANKRIKDFDHKLVLPVCSKLYWNHFLDLGALLVELPAALFVQAATSRTSIFSKQSKSWITRTFFCGYNN